MLNARNQTVQMIALIVKNRPPAGEKQSTLIVAPLALLDQWQLEIESKTNLGLQCLIYHGELLPLVYFLVHTDEVGLRK